MTRAGIHQALLSLETLLTPIFLLASKICIHQLFLGLESLLSPYFLLASKKNS